MSEDDLTFHRRRLAEELENERGATSPAIASAHRLLAQMYAQRMEDFTSPVGESFLLRDEKRRENISQRARRPKLSLRK